MKKVLKIVADKHIPYLDVIPTDYFNIDLCEVGEINPSRIADADALLVRTRTQCNALLLKGSRVQFIGTATIGYDHIDTNYCQQHGIVWTNAPGCNADAVANYISSALKVIAPHPQKLCLGVVGVGHVGKRVVRVAQNAGFGRILKNDPPRVVSEGLTDYADLDTLLREADIITLHTPLTPSTYHLVDKQFISKCRASYLINAARGPICHTQALLQASQQLIIDCWEDEPAINQDLLQHALIATPHIAGYSLDGKARATEMVCKALLKHFGIDYDCHIQLPKPSQADCMYDILHDSDTLKAHPEQFEALRNHYQLRRDSVQFAEAELKL